VESRSFETVNLLARIEYQLSEKILPIEISFVRRKLDVRWRILHSAGGFDSGGTICRADA
jgi:hypothetical protein